MRRARVLVEGKAAGVLSELESGGYAFEYLEGYTGPPVSLTMPLTGERFQFSQFPPFFEGLLPEGFQLDHLLRLRKLDRDDPFGQLLAVGADLVGTVTVEGLS